MLGRDERHQKDKQCRLIVYTCIDLPGTRSGIHLQFRTFPLPWFSSGNDRILPHTAMSDMLLVMVMAPSLLLGAEA